MSSFVLYVDLKRSIVCELRVVNYSIRKKKLLMLCNMLVVNMRWEPIQTRMDIKVCVVLLVSEQTKDSVTLSGMTIGRSD
jgi:hypothetical protein